MAKYEKKSPKASPLIITRVIKTSAEGEQVERIRKRRRLEEQPKEIVLIVEAEREFENEEMGVFEDYTEQPVLFPTTTEEKAALLVRTENRGKQRVEAEESSSFELLVLMKEMRIRDEQLREELRWRDENQATEKKRREENLTALI